MTTRLIVAAALVFAYVGTAMADTSEAAFKKAWDAAEAARQQAASLGHEWRDTEQMLEDAKALAGEGDYEQAMQLVERAKFEGERAIEQAEQQAKLWQEAVPK